MKKIISDIFASLIIVWLLIIMSSGIYFLFQEKKLDYLQVIVWIVTVFLFYIANIIFLKYLDKD